MTTSKSRLDRRLVELGLVESRARAQGLVLAGQVKVNGQTQTKAGFMVQETDEILLSEPKLAYVSRGGLKLEAALDHFGIQPHGWTVLDVGASTGGFTDCWLQHGAQSVYAVDVGYGQLAWSLRNDPRVVVHERLNARWLTLDQIGRQAPLDAASIDASFIGISLLLAPVAAMLQPGGSVMALVKPQFEAGPENLGKRGVVRDPKVHQTVLKRFWQSAQNMGYSVQGLIPSPIKGPEGNIEFLAYLQLGGTSLEMAVDSVVDQAWQGESE